MRQRPTSAAQQALGKFDDPNSPLGAIIHNPHLTPDEKSNLFEALSNVGPEAGNVLIQVLSGNPPASNLPGAGGTAMGLQEAVAHVLNGDFDAQGIDSYGNVKFTHAHEREVTAAVNNLVPRVGGLGTGSRNQNSALQYLSDIAGTMHAHAAVLAGGAPFPEGQLDPQVRGKVEQDISLYFSNLKSRIQLLGLSSSTEADGVYGAALAQFARTPSGVPFKFTLPDEWKKNNSSSVSFIETMVSGHLGRLQDYISGKDTKLEEHFPPNHRKGSVDNLPLVANPAAQKFALDHANKLAVEHYQHFGKAAEKKRAKEEQEELKLQIEAREQARLDAEEELKKRKDKMGDLSRSEAEHKEKSGTNHAKGLALGFGCAILLALVCPYIGIPLLLAVVVGAVGGYLAINGMPLAHKAAAAWDKREYKSVRNSLEKLQSGIKHDATELAKLQARKGELEGIVKGGSGRVEDTKSHALGGLNPDGSKSDRVQQQNLQKTGISR